MKNSLTEITKEEEFRKKLIKGMNKICDTVGSTFGPYGRNVLIERKVHEVPVVTNDGKRVAKAIEPEDPVERMVVKTLYDISNNTDLKAGDGTSGTLILAKAIINEAFERIPDKMMELTGVKDEDSSSVIEIRRQINEAKDKALDLLEEERYQIDKLEDLKKVAVTSIEDEELGTIIAEMVKEIGEDGYIFIEDRYNFGHHYETLEGMKFGGQIAADYMITNRRNKESEAKEVPVIVTNHHLESVDDFLRFDESGEPQGSIFGDVSKNHDELVIMAWKFEKQFLNQIAGFWKKGFKVYCVKVPSILTEQLRDIAIYCGTPLVDENLDMNLNQVALSDLGEVDRITIGQEETVLVGGKGSQKEIDKRIEELKEQREKEEIPEFKKKIDRRIGDLSSGIGIIKIGSDSQIEQIYLYDKVKDAFNATKEAYKNGVVKGGGVTLKEISEKLEEDSILKKPLTANNKKIKSNAGFDLEIPDDVIDPYGVIKSQIENACSAAGALITTATGINIKRDDSIKEVAGKIADEFTDRNIPIDPNGPDEY